MTGKGKGAALRAFSSASSPPFKNVAVLKGFLSVEQNRFKLARFPLETDKSSWERQTTVRAKLRISELLVEVN